MDGSCNDDEETVYVYAAFSDFKDARFLRETQVLKVTQLEHSPACAMDGFDFHGDHEVSLGSLLFVQTDAGAVAGAQAPPIVLCNTKTDFKMTHVPKQQQPSQFTQSSVDTTDAVGIEEATEVTL